MNNLRKIMMVVLVMVVTFALTATGSEAKNTKMTSKAGQYTVAMTLDKGDPVVGDNIATIEIKDMEGKYVLDAKVVVEYSMPAMPGMPAMNYKAKAKSNAEQYIATMTLPMAGAWNIAVKITRDGKTESAKYNVDAK
ncbi:MAG: FixH family protein [Nitrospirae bacterium YQR-1]